PTRHPPGSTLSPYTTLFRSVRLESGIEQELGPGRGPHRRRSAGPRRIGGGNQEDHGATPVGAPQRKLHGGWRPGGGADDRRATRSEEHTSELQSRSDLVCRL